MNQFAEMDLTDPLFLLDPYAVYAALRSAGGVAYNRPLDAFMLTSYEAVDAASRNPDFGGFRPTGRPEVRELERMLSHWTLHRTGADHEAARGALRPGFTGPGLDRIAPVIRSLIDGLLAGPAFQCTPAGAGRADFISDFAEPLSMGVIGAVLGLPASDQEVLRGWMEDLFAYLGGGLDAGNDAAAIRATALAVDYFRERLSEDRPAEEETLIAVLGRRAGPEDLDERAANCVMLAAAGYYSSKCQLGNGLHALFTHPGEFERLRGEPDLLGPAIEEMLRFDSALQCPHHVMRRDAVVAGVKVPAGAGVVTAIGAANRDPAHFPDPDRFRVDRMRARTGSAHLAFGRGAHYCIGAGLFRLEARIAFERLLETLSDLGPDSENRPRRILHSLLFRGFDRLPIRFQRSRG